MSDVTFPRLHLREPFDEMIAYEISCKGWYSGAVAELPNGHFYPLFFYDPVRLAQDLAADMKYGCPCIDEEALVIVPNVNEDSMRAAIRHLFQCKWFERLVPSVAKSPIEALRLVGQA